mgnify:CR=1 FL=1
MSELYSKIESLCASKGIKVSHLCAAVGTRSGMLSDLKMGRKQTLSVELIAKIADYFGVSVDYLIGKEPAETAPALTKKDERDIAKDMERLRQSLETGDGLMFDGDPLSDEAKESILAAMKMGLEIAKVKNKEKYTPKKYRKETGND